MRTLVFLTAAVNPVWVRAALPAGRGRVVAAAVAALLGFAAVVALAAVSGPVLDALDVSPSTFRIAAGAVAAIGGAVRLVVPLPRPEPAGDVWRAGLVPVAFPTLLTPDLGLLALSLGADEGVLPVALAAAVALALLVAAAVVPPPQSGRAGAATTGMARVIAAVLVVAGVALAVDGVQDL